MTAHQRERPVLFHIASDMLASQHCATTACGMASAEKGKTLLRLLDAVAEMTVCYYIAWPAFPQPSARNDAARDCLSCPSKKQAQNNASQMKA